MVRRVLFTLSLLSACLMVTAQQSLNLYTTSKGVVSFTFTEEPRVTFPKTDTVTVSTADVTVEFPFAEVEKMTFEDGVTQVETITVRDGDQTVTIYDLGGRLVRQYIPQKGITTVNLQALPAGTYVVRDGKRSYKILKR